MKIHLINQQKKYQIKESNISQLSEYFGSKIQTRLKKWGDISIIIVPHEKMINLNKSHFNKNKTTDVISFFYTPIPGEEKLYSGDIIINIDQVMKEGLKRGDINYEIAFYIAHGFDHLNGSKDDTPLKRYIMHHREKTWLKKAKNLKLLDDLIS